MSADDRILTGQLVPAGIDWADVDDSLRRALEMREGGATWGEVASAVGERIPVIRERVLAYQLALKAHVVENREAYRVMELQRLDALQRAYWGAAVEAGDVRAAEFLLKVSRRRDEVMGGSASAAISPTVSASSSGASTTISASCGA